MSDTPRDPTDERDARLAALLETEPLDEVTRTRLVRTALAASDPGGTATGGGAPRSRSRLRWLAVAAVVVVVLAVGFGTLVRNDSDSRNTAARASRAPSPLQEEAPTNLTVGPEAGGLDVNGASLLRLGDLGDVGSSGKLRRAVAAVVASAPATDSKSPDSKSPDSKSPDSKSPDSKSSDEAAQATTVLPRTSTTGCVPSLPGDVVAVGTGTARGQPVTVYLVQRKGGARVAVTVDADCTTGEPVPI